ncbi:MAG: hypothetical protein CMP11_08700 [Zetaproteobacteria bacterium]|nr:hypothetical protein [Pseudobdellovibrionaceae bacterium]|tara:strand:+ start:1563 stop:1844 length:282 start_codon:yes stop_codon:yes gene_type:complete
MSQIEKKFFAKSLEELGYDPLLYQSQKISLEKMAMIYNFNLSSLLDAIEAKKLNANYNYQENRIWVDTLEAAYFHYCVQEANKEKEAINFSNK